VEADVHPADNQTEVVTEVRLAADLALSVIGAPTPVLIGRDAVVDFSVTNGGPGTAHGTTLRYKLPVGVLLTSFVASQGFVTNENGILTFYFGEVPVTGVANARIVMTPQAVGTLTNAVSVVAEEVDPNPSDNQLELVWTVVPAVDLQVAQRVEPDPSLLGEPFQIEIAVTNAGPSVASEIQIDDPLSGTLELIDISVSQGTWTNSGAHITWFADALPPSGEARATLTVRGIGIGAITNIVTASASQQDLNPTDNVAVAVLHVDPAADLALSAEVNPVAAILGQSVSYQLTVTNLGPGDATGVVLVESPPAGVNVIDVEISQGSWTNLSGQILVNFGDVGAGGNANARIVVQPVAVGTITNSASVTAAEADPRALNNGANTISIVELDADLFVELTASATSVLLGKDLVYQIGVTNNGPNTAHTVRIDDVLPTGATVMSVVLEQGTWTNFSGALRWDAGSLPPGTGAAATVTVQIGIAGIATNVVMVASDQVDTNTVNNSASSVVTVMPSADLALEQRVEPDPGWLGQELAFVITVTNRGPSVAHSVTVIDDLPIGITLLRIESSQGVSTNYAGRVTWNAGELAVGATAGISLIFRADQTGSFANNARVSADEIDEHVSDNLSAANATVVPAVDLQVTQQVQPLLAVTGETATYEIIVTNAGPSLATGLILTDTLPGGVTLTDVQASGGIVTNSGDVVSIAFGALDVGETATATIVVTPNAAGTMTNSVVVSAEQPDVAPADNRSIAINTVKVEADLALSIPPRSAVALVGFDLPYSFSITNQGPAEAHDVLLIDQLPADADLTRVEPSQGSWTETNGIVRCELGSLAPGAVATVNIVVRTLVSGGMTNVATVDADVLDRNPTNNVQVTVDTVYPPADLQITQTASADPVLVNDQLTYRITVLNESPYAVPQLVVTDTLPAGTELTSTATTYGSITNDQTTVTFDLGGLAPGGSATLTLTVTPRVVGMITNHAEIVSPFASPANAGLISILATRVIATPLLEVERSGNRLIFSWPEIAGSYLLEYTDQLGNSAVWAEVQSPVVVVNERVTVTVKIFGEARFFRLRKI
jgi:uncharacterized repeat protein (TIGR01451 family)